MDRTAGLAEALARKTHSRRSSGVIRSSFCISQISIQIHLRLSSSTDVVQDVHAAFNCGRLS